MAECLFRPSFQAYVTRGIPSIAVSMPLNTTSIQCRTDRHCKAERLSLIVAECMHTPIKHPPGEDLTTQLTLLLVKVDPATHSSEV